jgi:hypothetical protein
MKHLKNWEQLNELHSDTYKDFGKKHLKQLLDPWKEDSVYTMAKDMASANRDNDDMFKYVSGISDRDKNSYTNMRKAYRKLQEEDPEILQILDINNWRNLYKIREIIGDKIRELRSLVDKETIKKLLSNDLIMDKLYPTNNILLGILETRDIDTLNRFYEKLQREIGEDAKKYLENFLDYGVQADVPEYIRYAIEKGYDISDITKDRVYKNLLFKSPYNSIPILSKYIDLSKDDNKLLRNKIHQLEELYSSRPYNGISGTPGKTILLRFIKNLLRIDSVRDKLDINDLSTHLRDELIRDGLLK